LSAALIGSQAQARGKSPCLEHSTLIGSLGAALREGQAIYASAGLHDKTQAANPGGGQSRRRQHG